MNAVLYQTNVYTNYEVLLSIFVLDIIEVRLDVLRMCVSCCNGSWLI